MRTHHKLLVWQEAIALVKDTYKLTGSFPQYELYALSSQMRRAAVSVPSNIAEGAARMGKKEFIQFLAISRGSLSELETQFIVSKELGYIEDLNEIMKKIEKLFGLISGLINSLRDRNKNE